VVFVEQEEELVGLVDLVDQHLLQQVVGQTDYLDGLGAAQLQGGQLAIRDPFLGGLGRLALQDFQALLGDSLHALACAHI
jgi:hypothetical protein